jgi:hypothetical protein
MQQITQRIARLAFIFLLLAEYIVSRANRTIFRGRYFSLCTKALMVANGLLVLSVGEMVYRPTHAGTINVSA